MSRTVSMNAASRSMASLTVRLVERGPGGKKLFVDHADEPSSIPRAWYPH